MSAVDNQHAFLPKLAGAVRPHAPWLLGGMILGGVLGLIVHFATPTVYQAKGSFLVNQLPFGLQDTTGSDPETSRQLVQSLILSVSSEGMRHQVAELVGVPDTDLAFAGHDLPVSLASHDKLRANIEITSTRNSRLGVVSAESADRAFAAKVVDAVFAKMQVLNQIAGRLEQIEFRLKLNNTEAASLVQELSTVAADRVKFQTQNQALDTYIAQKNSLENFPPFATDATLSNLKTQLILVSSDYASLAAQSTSGGRLQGKRGELDSLRSQIHDHTEDLARALRASLQISQTREATLRSDIIALEQSNARLEALRTNLSRGFGDFTLRDDLSSASDPNITGEASVIVVIDAAYAVPKPVRPILALNLGLGLLLGLGLGFAISSVRAQFRQI
jgi:uncharacterized protein involved in exopolysaccharide biosynthesis